MAVDGTPPFTPASVDPDPDKAIKNLLVTSGTPFYPLARRLYATTTFGFANIPGGEGELAACFGQTSAVGAAMATAGYAPIPGGLCCVDYPEQSASAQTPPANTRGAGAVALGGCDAGLAGHNACTDPSTAPTITP